MTTETAVSRLHDEVMKPIPRDLPTYVTLPLETAIALDKIIAELCEDHGKCDGCGTALCETCGVGQVGSCDHGGVFCRGCDVELCNDCAREMDEDARAEAYAERHGLKY